MFRLGNPHSGFSIPPPKRLACRDNIRPWHYLRDPNCALLSFSGLRAARKIRCRSYRPYPSLLNASHISTQYSEMSSTWLVRSSLYIPGFSLSSSRYTEIFIPPSDHSLKHLSNNRISYPAALPHSELSARIYPDHHLSSQMHIFAVPS